MELNKIHCMDCLEGLRQLSDESVDLVVTSPPYNMNDKRYYKEYNDNREDYVDWIVSISLEVKRVLKKQGVFCLNISYNNNSRDSYIKIINSLLEKGFLLQETVSWRKRGMPLTEIGNFTRDFEFIFVLVKDKDFYISQKKNEIISNVWSINNNNTQINGNNACFPLDLPKKIIKIFTQEEGVVLDPFMGSGTTAVACKQLNRNFIGFEINQEYIDYANKRLEKNVTLHQWEL